MSRRWTCFALALALSAATLRVEGAAASVHQDPSTSSVRTINDQADARRGADPVAVRRLVDSVFSASFEATDSPFAQSLSAELKDRLVRAELRFRTRARRGIPELNVVRVVNGLADRLAAPSYAKSCTYEVRRIRGSLLPVYPKLIHRAALKNAATSRGAGLSAEMSPVEAFVVVTTLIEQKRFNREWQVTQEERSLDWYRGKARAEAVTATNPRADELAARVTKGLLRMTPAELRKVSHQAMTLLGIEA